MKHTRIASLALIAIVAVTCGAAAARAESGVTTETSVSASTKLAAPTAGTVKEDTTEKMKIEKESFEREKNAISIRAKIAAVTAQMAELQKKLDALKAELASTGTVSTDAKMKAGKFEKDFSFGEKGDHVKRLQEILIKKGLLPEGNDTGFFGMMTKEAVRKFQMQKGIEAVGVIGPMTRAKLNVEAE